MIRHVSMNAAKGHLWTVFPLILYLRRTKKAKEKKGILLCLTIYGMIETVKGTEACIITPTQSFTAAVTAAAMPLGGKLYQN